MIIILDWFKLKEFKDKKNVTQSLKIVSRWVKNNAGKGKNAVYISIFPFPTMFLKGFFLRVVKELNCICSRVIGCAC